MTQVVLMTGGMLIGTLASLWGARWPVVSMSAPDVLAMIVIHAALPRARLIR